MARVKDEFSYSAVPPGVPCVLPPRGHYRDRKLENYWSLVNFGPIHTTSAGKANWTVSFLLPIIRSHCVGRTKIHRDRCVPMESGAGWDNGTEAPGYATDFPTKGVRR